MTAEPVQNRSPTQGEHRASAKLIIAAGRDRGRVYPIPRDGELSLGRSETNDIVVRDSEVSRRHCTIAAAGGTFQIRDNRSTNGTFVNGERVTQAPLESSAELFLGQTAFTFALADDTRAVAPVLVGEPAAPAAPVPGGAASPVLEARPAVQPKRPAVPPPAAAPRRGVLPVVAIAASVALVAGAVYLAWPSGDRADQPEPDAASKAPAAESPPPAGPARSIEVTSSPEGAEVFLDNRFLGLAPLRIEVTAGEPHALRLAKHGCQTQRMAIDDSSPAEITLELPPESTATVLVTASKPDTAVYLDGTLMGRTAGNQELRIPGVKLGEHELRLVKTNYLSCLRRIDVIRPGRMRVHGKLESRKEAALLNLIVKEPDSALRHTELGHYHMVNRQFDKAMRAYRKAVDLVYAGRDTSGHRTRLSRELRDIALGYQGVFRYGTAEDTRIACEKLEDMYLSLATKHSVVRSRLTTLAKQYTARGHPEDAIRLYRKMLAVQPDNLNLYYQVASMYMAQNDHEGEIAVLRQALDRFPDNWNVHYRLGQAYWRKACVNFSADGKRLAVKHLGRALELCKSSVHQRSIQVYLDKAKELGNE